MHTMHNSCSMYNFELLLESKSRLPLQQFSGFRILYNNQPDTVQQPSRYCTTTNKILTFAQVLIKQTRRSRSFAPIFCFNFQLLLKQNPTKCIKSLPPSLSVSINTEIRNLTLPSCLARSGSEKQGKIFFLKKFSFRSNRELGTPPPPMIPSPTLKKNMNNLQNILYQRLGRVESISGSGAVTRAR